MLIVHGLDLWLRAFVFTQIIEAPIYRRALGCTWLAALGASALTHPFVWFLFPPLGHALGVSYLATSIASELFAWGVEAIYFARLLDVPWRRAIGTSLLANGVSVTLGLLSRHFFGAP